MLFKENKMIEVLNSDGIDQIRYSIYNRLGDTKLSKKDKDGIIEQVHFLVDGYMQLRNIILDCYIRNVEYDCYECRFCFAEKENGHFDGCIAKALE